MFVLGHVGVGYRLAKPWTQNLSTKAVIVGTLLPDIIDKALYYSFAAWTGKSGGEIGLISGTRTFGHTLLFLVTLGLFSLFVHKLELKRVILALWLGVLSHLLLDYFTDYFRASAEYVVESDPLFALFFPFLGWRFPYSVYHDAGEHVQTMLVSPFILFTEGLGVWVAYREGWFGAIASRIFRKSV